MRQGQHFDTGVIQNEDNPKWGQDGKGEQFGFLVHEPRHQSLSLVLYDYDKLGNDDQLGWCAAPLLHATPPAALPAATEAASAAGPACRTCTAKSTAGWCTSARAVGLTAPRRRYNLAVRDLPRGRTQRMRLPMQGRAADPSGARGKQGMETLRLKASELLSNAKALAHRGTCHLLLEVRRRACCACCREVGPGHRRAQRMAAGLRVMCSLSAAPVQERCVRLAGQGPQFA